MLAELTFAFFYQVASADRISPIFHYFPLCVVQGQNARKTFENIPIGLNHFGLFLRHRTRATDIHVDGQLADIANLRAMKRGSDPHIVVVTAWDFFIEAPGL